MKIICICAALLAHPFFSSSQTTAGSISGSIYLLKKPLPNAYIVLNHIASGRVYQTNSNTKGYYYFSAIEPGLGYTMQIAHTTTDSLLIENIAVVLGGDLTLNVELKPMSLMPVTVTANFIATGKPHQQAILISANELEATPARGRSFSGLFNNQPTALVNNNTGALSFSGQNNRYNSIYLDGALQNDVFGLSPSGSFGGQAGSFPAATETIEQMQILLSPFDASLGGYTGAAINMITKSGKNNPVSTIYRYWKGHQHTQNNTGVSLSGPIKQNKLFYYLNGDYTKESASDLYAINNYKGDTKNPAQLANITHTFQTIYGYDPGGVNSINNQTALRLTVRVDAKLNARNNLTLHLKQNQATRINTPPGNETAIIFLNNGKQIQHQLLSAAVEWKFRSSKKNDHQLLFNYTFSKDLTQPRGLDFPSLRILDGDAIILLGNNEDAMHNSISQSNTNLLYKRSFSKGKNRWVLGTELEYNAMKNNFIQSRNGSFFYYSLSNFFQNRTPGGYRANYTLKEEPDKIHALKTALFVNHQWRINKNMSVQTGLRMSYQAILNSPPTDAFTNDSALPILQKKYAIANNLSGNTPVIRPSISPRIYWQIEIPNKKINLQIGTGWFSGRMPFAWLGGLYSNNGNTSGAFDPNTIELRKIRFRNPLLEPWSPSSHQINASKGAVHLANPKITMPLVWRSMLQMKKIFNNQYSVSMEAMHYINTAEIGFTNINILPATQKLEGADNRLIHSNINNAKIPIRADSTNPYDQIILLHNQNTQRGYGYRFGLMLNMQSPNFNWQLQYNYGESYAVQDGNYSILGNHWRLNEQVNGRNDLVLARSDFSMGHRVHFSMHYNYAITRKQKITVALFYNGQSGTPYSFVYGKRSLSGDDIETVGYDLIYIPTALELANQVFQPFSTQDIYYTAEQQKEALEWFIEQDAYLKKNRGNYAARNGSRSPFNHRIDLRVSGYIPIKIDKRRYGLGWSIDLMNMGNLLNSDWGRNWHIPGNRLRLIDFMGMLNDQSLVPTFNFDPSLIQKNYWRDANSNHPAFSEKWMLQLGLRVVFY